MPAGRDFIIGIWFWLWMIPFAVIAAILTAVIYGGLALSGTGMVIVVIGIILSIVLFVLSIWYQGYIIRTRFHGRR